MNASISFRSLLLACAATSCIVHAQDTYDYKLAINDSLINGNNNVIHWDAGQSTGTVKFCARVETFMNGLDNSEIATGTQDFKINIPFDVTNNIFNASSEVEVITVPDMVIDDDQNVHTSDSQWVQVGPKTTDVVNGINNELSRGVVAMSSDGTVVATGSRLNNGEVKVFKNDGGSLEQLGATFQGLQDDDSAFVSLSGDGQILAIASSQFLSASDNEFGFVKVYEYNQSSKTWDEQDSAAIVEAGTTPRSGWFGADGQLQLSDDGKTLVVGNSMKNNGQGRSTVYKFDESQSAWVKVNEFSGTQDGDNVGYDNALSSDGNVLAVGALGKSIVTMYEYNAVSKAYDLKNTISDPASTVDDLFGATLSLSANGQTIAIGAPSADVDTGKAFVYQQDVSGNWVQQGGAISGKETGEQASYGLFLSDDGNTVALSSKNNDGSKGRIHVYDLVDGAWTPKGNDILGASAGDYLSDFVLSGDGNTIFAGALGAGYAATYKYLDNWKIQAPVVTMDASSSDSSVYHLIGDMPISADVKLFDIDCKTLVGTGDVISISTKSFTKENHKLVYTFAMDNSKLGTSALVSFVDESQFQQSKGSINFCTRVETYYQPSFEPERTLASYLETNFVMNFDLTQNDFNIIGNTLENVIEDVIVDVIAQSGVNACFCTSGSFTCVTGEAPTFNQDENAYVCLEPKSTDLKISNLAMKLTANGFIYRAVEFGSSGWEVDAMTSIISDTASDKIQVKVTLPGGLFSDLESEMTITGNAFMQFKSSGRMLELAPYNLTASVGADADEECFRGFGLLKKLFNAVDNIGNIL